MIKNYFKIIFCSLIITGGFFIYPFFVFGATNDVVINEIAWMGTDISYADEWIELYNNTNEEIDLTNWTLFATDGKPEINLSGTITANGYFLLERTNDESVIGITADQIYTGDLGNNGENLELKNAEDILINSINCSDEWTSGDNDTKQTMEKTDTGWQTSLNSGGTPKEQNSIGASDETINEETTEEASTSTGSTSSVPNRPPMAEAGTDIVALVNQELSFDASHSLDLDNDKLTFFWNFGDGATDTEKISKHTYLYPGQYIVSLLISDGEFSDLDIITVNIYSQSIIISEFSNEWIEIFNQSDQVANLTNWQLKNQKASSSPFLFPANSLMAPNQFLVLRQEITKIELDNDSDQIQLIYPDGSIGAEVSYLSEDKEIFCIAFDNESYFWTKIPTPGSANIISRGIENQKETFSSNNPEPDIKQTQEIPEVLATNLTENQNFDTQEISTTSINNLLKEIPKNNIQNTQSASISQNIQSNQKSKLILYLSIIVSSSLMLGWVIVLLKNRVKFH